MLPKDILGIIDDYVNKFCVWDSLPSVRRIKKLITTSDTHLIQLVADFLFIPPHLFCRTNFRYAFEMNPHTQEALDKALHFCMRNCWQTHAVFWMFLENGDCLYHGPYAKLFEESLFFQLLNLTTIPPERVSELGFVCLSKDDLTLGV